MRVPNLVQRLLQMRVFKLRLRRGISLKLAFPVEIISLLLLLMLFKHSIHCAEIQLLLIDVEALEILLPVILAHNRFALLLLLLPQLIKLRVLIFRNNQLLLMLSFILLVPLSDAE